MNEVAEQIVIGRRVHFFAGYGGIDGDGVIVAIHGKPNPGPTPTLHGGIGRVIRPNDCHVDVILFDGRKMERINQCSFNRPGIGYRLLDRVHGPALVARVHQLAAERVAREAIEKVQAADRFERGEAARKIERAPLFYWNGIKDAKGAPLQKAHYSIGGYARLPEGTITIYARDYARFSDLVRQCFAVENDTDTMVDYFDSDKIRVIPTHPLYPQVKAALTAQEAHQAKRRAKRDGGAA